MFEFVNINLKELEVEPINKDGLRFYPIHFTRSPWEKAR